MNSKSVNTDKKQPAIFLDRDGTINVDRDYIYRITDFEFIPGVPEALKLLQDAGYKLIIITNQSGIARGFYTEADYNTLNDWMLKTLREHYSVQINASYYCPHHPAAIIPEYKQDCNCRKPKLGLFERAVAENNIDLDGSWAIGDKLRDLAICESYKTVRGFLIGSKEDEHTINTVKCGEVERVSYADTLLTAALKILTLSPQHLRPF